MTSSIVLFLADPIESPLETAISRCLEAFGEEIEITTPPPDAAVAGEADQFRFARADQEFDVRISGRPIDPLPDLDDSTTSDAIRAALSKHSAWVSIDWVEQPETPEFTDVYLPIGRLAAAFCERPTTTLWLPQWDRHAAIEDDTPALLCSEQPTLGFGVVHTRLGCLVHEGSMWVGLIPTQWGPVEVAAVAERSGPRPADTDRMAELVWGPRLRVLRSRLTFSLLYRPYRLFLDADREISVHFRNSITGSLSKSVSESDVKF